MAAMGRPLFLCAAAAIVAVLLFEVSMLLYRGSLMLDVPRVVLYDRGTVYVHKTVEGGREEEELIPPCYRTILKEKIGPMQSCPQGQPTMVHSSATGRNHRFQVFTWATDIGVQSQQCYHWATSALTGANTFFTGINQTLGPSFSVEPGRDQGVWYTNVLKLFWTLKALNCLEDDDYALFVDGKDVLFLNAFNAQSWVDVLEQKEASVLLQGELNVFPRASRSLYEEYTPGRIERSRKPYAPNSGVVVGRVSGLRPVIGRIVALLPTVHAKDPECIKLAERVSPPECDPRVVWAADGLASAGDQMLYHVAYKRQEEMLNSNVRVAVDTEEQLSTDTFLRKLKYFDVSESHLRVQLHREGNDLHVLHFSGSDKDTAMPRVLKAMNAAEIMSRRRTELAKLEFDGVHFEDVCSCVFEEAGCF